MPEMRPYLNKHQQQTIAASPADVDPRDFFVGVVLHITEARFPDKNAGGRGEGPHLSLLFPSSKGPALTHACDLAHSICLQARRVVDESTVLWSRNIPTCLNVFLLPDQCANVGECMAAHGVLLERWTIQALPKRNSDNKLLLGQFLLQAIRSHLHFSQLSAWLIESRGKSPCNVTYRIEMPGETDCAKSWSNVGNNEKHQFPSCQLDKSSILNVSVESLPRPFNLQTLRCKCINIVDHDSTIVVAVPPPIALVDDKETGASPAPSPHSSSSIGVNLSSESNKLHQDQASTSLDFDSGLSIDSSSSPSTSSASTIDDVDYKRSGSSLKHSSPYTSYQTINLPSFENFLSSPPKNVRIFDKKTYDGKLLASPEDEVVKAKKTTFCSATNPLFDTSNAAAAIVSSEASLKQRIEQLRNEAMQLKMKWQRYAPVSENRSTLSTFVKSSDVRFFVADDDDECDDTPSTSTRKTTSSEEDNDRSIKKDDDDRNLSGRVVKCRKILFSGENEMFDNADDIPASLIDFVLRSATNDEDAERSKTTFTETKDAKADVAKNDGVSKTTTIRKDGEAERCGRRQNESLFARKWTKKTPHSAAVLHFNGRTGLPLSSSPAPLKRNQNSFDFDTSLSSVTAIKSALYYNNDHESGSSDSDSGVPLCKSAPASTNLLGNFEESALNGRIKPFGSVEGFSLELGASGAFCPSHVTLSVTTLFFNVSDDNAPSPYFGHCSLDSVSRKGYHTPKKGTVQATLFNPQGTVVKMFVVRYDLADMPACCQTFVRQRTFFMPSSATLDDALHNRSWLRYLIHLRFATSRSGKLYLHTDIRMLFSRKSELDAYNIDYVAGESADKTKADTFELRSFTELPKNPKFSPRKVVARVDREREREREIR